MCVGNAISIAQNSLNTDQRLQESKYNDDGITFLMTLILTDYSEDRTVSELRQSFVTLVFVQALELCFLF